MLFMKTICYMIDYYIPLLRDFKGLSNYTSNNVYCFERFRYNFPFYNGTVVLSLIIRCFNVILVCEIPCELPKHVPIDMFSLYYIEKII